MQLSTTTCFASAIWSKWPAHVRPSINEQPQADNYIYSTATQQGLGQDLRTVSEDQIENYMKGMFVSEAGWASTIFIVKSSILAFYWRLFNAKGRAFRFSIWAFLVLTVCWGIAVVSSCPLINLLC